MQIIKTIDKISAFSLIVYIQYANIYSALPP